MHENPGPLGLRERDEVSMPAKVALRLRQHAQFAAAMGWKTQADELEALDGAVSKSTLSRILTGTYPPNSEYTGALLGIAYQAKPPWFFSDLFVVLDDNGDPIQPETKAA
jgi:hypothetical protein